MSADSDEEEWKKLCDGPNGEVWIHKACEKELGKIKQLRMQAKAFAVLKNKFCKLESLDDLRRNQFKIYAKKHSSKGISAKLSHARGDDIRIYGALGSVSGCRAFFASHAIIKKANKLDSNDADTSVGRLVGLSERIPGAQL